MLVALVVVIVLVVSLANLIHLWRDSIQDQVHTALGSERYARMVEFWNTLRERSARLVHHVANAGFSGELVFRLPEFYHAARARVVHVLHDGYQIVLTGELYHRSIGAFHVARANITYVLDYATFQCERFLAARGLGGSHRRAAAFMPVSLDKDDTLARPNEDESDECSADMDEDDVDYEVRKLKSCLEEGAGSKLEDDRDDRADNPDDNFVAQI